MINAKMIARIMGALFFIEAGFLILCSFLAVYYNESDISAFLYSAAITAGAERPQTLRGTEIKNQIPWSMAKAHAAAISNRFQQPSFSASLRPMSTPMTEAIISPRVQPEESPRQCRP